jgi:hypothetical protein
LKIQILEIDLAIGLEIICISRMLCYDLYLKRGACRQLRVAKVALDVHIPVLGELNQCVEAHDQHKEEGGPEVWEERGGHRGAVLKKGCKRVKMRKECENSVTTVAQQRRNSSQILGRRAVGVRLVGLVGLGLVG